MSEKKDLNWWRGAVIYQIYPRSFLDTNGDGIGDLPGIADRLDYVAKLGVDGVWISPFFHSPMKDFGYDVSDYRSVDPTFGTNEDFDIVLKRAHDLGLKVIIDMVLSHTSTEHPWFIESRLSKTNRKADWYVWADPKEDGSPPNNWQSLFGGSAWTFDTHRAQYYLHNFLQDQPDLNYHNPAVQNQVLSECRYWLERGVDGFRLDTVNFYFHDKELRDNPPRKTAATEYATQYEKPDPYSMQAHLYDKSQPEMFEFLERLRTLMDEYPGSMTVGEIGDDDPYKLAAQYTDQNKYLNTTYNTHMMAGTDSKSFDKSFIQDPTVEFEKQPGEGWPSWALCNHDVVRVVTRWGQKDGYEQEPDFAKALIALLGCLRGTIYLYQGEELGLSEASIPYERIQDPWGKYLWPEWQGRDGCRTPMPWHAEEPHSGFSTGEGDTWLPIPEWHRVNAVNIQKENPKSVLNFSRDFLNWRKEKDVLKTGTIKFLETSGEKLIAFERTLEQEKVICAFNVSSKQAEIPYETETGERPSFCTGERKDTAIILPPFGAFIANVKSTS